MKWQGTFHSAPTLAVQNGILHSPVFTVRRKNGVLRVFFKSSQNDIIECDYPGVSTTYATAPAASANCVNWGRAYAPLLRTGDVARRGATPRIRSAFIVTGIHWSDQCACLFATGGDGYNVAGYNDPVLVRGDPSDGTGVMTWTGPWRLKGSSRGLTARPTVHQTHSFIVDVPQAWGQRYANGATIAMGGNSWSGNIQCSFGDTLWAFRLPTPNQPNYLTHGADADIPAINLVGGDFNHRQPRQGDYAWPEYSNVEAPMLTGPASRTELTGQFGSMDSNMDGSALWLDWSDKQIVAFLHTRGRGHLWYSSATNKPVQYTCKHGHKDRYFNTGPVANIYPGQDPGTPYNDGPDWDMSLTLRDPMKLAPVTGVRADRVEIADMKYLRDVFPSFVYDNTQGGVNVTRSMGLAADQASRLIFIPVNGVPAAGAARHHRYDVNVFAVPITPEPPSTLPVLFGIAGLLMAGVLTRKAA